MVNSQNIVEEWFVKHYRCYGVQCGSECTQRQIAPTKLKTDTRLGSGGGP